jgi:hypothetical protein
MLKVRVERVSQEGDVESTTIGGFDHNFPRVYDYTDVINRFFLHIAERWPEAIFYIDDDPRGIRLKLRRQDLPATLPEEGVAIIVRDDVMDAQSESEGAVPMPDGESVLVLWFHREGDAHYLDLVTVSDPLENEFCWWAVEQIWDVYLTSKKARLGRNRS